MRRVVVTGVGVVSPYGVGVGALWSGLCSGRGAVSGLQGPAFAPLPSKVAGQVSPDHYQPAQHFAQADLKRLHRSVQFALVAASEALDSAGWHPDTAAHKAATGVCVGTGIGALDDIGRNAMLVDSGQWRKVSPFFIPRVLLNMPSGQISIRYGFQGPNHCAVTACATGAHCIGDAMRFVQHGDASVMVAGGTEACIDPLAVAGFARLKSLSTNFNDTPERASRPWDKQRDGFVIAEGAGVVVLEEREHALARGATIHAELVGYGASGDGFHITAPPEDGSGARLAMERAMRSAAVHPHQIRVVNAHATSTPLGDIAELRALRQLIPKDHVIVGVANKSHLGHLLGAAGAVESVAAILGLREGIVPPTINLEQRDDALDELGVEVPAEKTALDHSHVLCNSFGFGGTNASLIFARHD